jgi:hypothetical protein
MSQSAMPSLVHRAEAHAGDGLDTPGCTDLLSFLSAVTDPRQRRGVRHGMASLLTVAAAAVVAGARSFAAIGEWAADASQEVLAALGIRCNARVGRHLPPDEATLRRALQKVDPDEVDRLFAAFLATRRRAPGAATDPVLAENVIHPAQGQYRLNLDQFESTAPRIADDGCGIMARRAATTGVSRCDERARAAAAAADE